jgi:hypothetical protein
MSLFWKILVFDEGTESADIATNENILLLDEYSKVKLFDLGYLPYLTDFMSYFFLRFRLSPLPDWLHAVFLSLVATSADSVPSSYLVRITIAYLGCNTVFDMRLRITFPRRKTVSLQSSIAHRE